MSNAGVPQWVDLMHSVREVARMSFRLRRVKSAQRADGFFDDALWQSVWLDPTKELMALKPCAGPAFRKAMVEDPAGVLPTDKEIEEMQENDCFLVYQWPALTRIGYVGITSWREMCPDALPVVDVPFWTPRWYEQNYGGVGVSSKTCSS